MRCVAVITGLLLLTWLSGGAAVRGDGPAGQCGGTVETCGPSAETCAPPGPQPAGPKVVVKVPRQIEVQQPAPAEAAAPAGVYVAPAQTGVYQGPSRAYGIEGMVITFPQWQLKLPSIQFPSLFVARRNARLVTDSAEAPYVVAGSQTVQASATANVAAPQPTLAAPAYVAATPQVAGPATPYAVGPPQAAYVAAGPLMAPAGGPSPPGRWVLIQGPACQAPAATAQPQPAGDPGAMETKLRQLQEREQHLQDRIEELQRYIEQQRGLQGPAVPACPPAPMPSPDCGSQSDGGRRSVIQQSVYREAIAPTAEAGPMVERLPRVE